MSHEYRRAQAGDFAAIQQMLELYQYELSDIWPQELDAQGRYGYDLEPHRAGITHHAHVALHEGRPAGFALVSPAWVTGQAGHWMEQFFVLRRHRRSGLGRAFAAHVFMSHPGAWEVGEMTANVAAQSFWRDVIGAFCAGNYTERVLTEGRWLGVVQCFSVGMPRG